jgi:hypothetical protein
MGRNLGFRYRLEHKHRFESVYIVKWIIIDINLRARLEQPRTYIWKGCTGKWVTLDSNLDSGLEKEDHGFFMFAVVKTPSFIPRSWGITEYDLSRDFWHE